MSGGDGADIISGGTGDDTIDGGAGNDTYIWNLGDGMDTITDSQGTDKIVFGEGISYDDLSFSQTNSDLYINVQNMPNQGLLIQIILLQEIVTVLKPWNSATGTSLI